MAIVDSTPKPLPETEDVQQSDVEIVAAHTSIDRDAYTLHQRLKRSEDS